MSLGDFPPIFKVLKKSALVVVGGMDDEIFVFDDFLVKNGDHSSNILNRYELLESVGSVVRYLNFACFQNVNLFESLSFAVQGDSDFLFFRIQASQKRNQVWGKDLGLYWPT